MLPTPRTSLFLLTAVVARVPISADDHSYIHTVCTVSQAGLHAVYVHSEFILLTFTGDGSRHFPEEG